MPSRAQTLAFGSVTFWPNLVVVLCNTGKPPHVDEDMMDRMRTILSLCILGQLLSMSLASGSSGPSESPYSVYRSGMGWAAFLWALITWILYAGLPLGFIPYLRDFGQTNGLNSNTNDFTAEDTGGIPYDQVTEMKHYEIETYECPAGKKNSRLKRRAPSELPSQPPAAQASTCYPPLVSPQGYPQPEIYSAAGASYPPAALQPTCYPPQSTDQSFEVTMQDV